MPDSPVSPLGIMSISAQFGSHRGCDTDSLTGDILHPTAAVSCDFRVRIVGGIRETPFPAPEVGNPGELADLVEPEQEIEIPIVRVWIIDLPLLTRPTGIRDAPSNSAASADRSFDFARRANHRRTWISDPRYSFLIYRTGSINANAHRKACSAHDWLDEYSPRPFLSHAIPPAASAFRIRISPRIQA